MRSWQAPALNVLILAFIFSAMSCGLSACFSQAFALAGVDNHDFSHPLDPLTQKELETSVKVLKDEKKLGKDVSLVYVSRNEPPKDEILAYKAGAEIKRQAFAVLYDINSNQTHEALIDLKNSKLDSWTLREGVQPMQLEEDTSLGSDLINADPLWKRGLERRGIKNPDDVHFEMFVVGNPVDIDNPSGARLLRAYPYFRVKGNNTFSEPIEGLSALVNMTTRAVAIRDDKQIIPLAGIGGNYFDAKEIGPLRKPCKPLKTTMPKGPSFEIQGHEVQWQKWRFRFALDPREGLTLHTIGYEDAGKLRPILYRAGIGEVAVPYGAPGPDWVWRAPIDEGEYGLGRLTTSLRPGQEVPEYATTLDVPYVNSVGVIDTKHDAIAIWEQDGGILWEHEDDDANRTVTRRARQLVIGHLFTLGNYDYFTQYVFNQDGSMDVKVTLNGDVLSQGVMAKACQVCDESPDEEGNIVSRGEDRYGTLIAPNIVGINHQHFFSFRLDFDVDGRANSLYEMNVRPLSEGRGILQQNTFTLQKTLLRSEEEARRDVKPESDRCWKIVNPTAPRNLGHIPGYLLQPGMTSVPYCHPQSYNRLRAPFLDHNLWATRYRPGEMHSAGEYPVTSKGGQGLAAWSGTNSIENQDLVVWYTLGLTHCPRVEDWPVMNAAHMGFHIVPDAFFSRNPALDVPGTPEPAAEDKDHIRAND